MNVFVVAIAGGLGGLGLLLMLRGLVGTTTPLAVVLDELHRPRTGAVVESSRRAAFVGQLAGRPTASRTSDLAVCARDEARWVQDRATWAAMFAAPGLVFLFLSAAGLVAQWPPMTFAAVALVGAAGGWVYARLDLGSDATKARREFRHAIAAYLELVTILMSGGAGVETAMFDAADTGRGSAFRHVRSALGSAQARREAPWRALGQLGARLGVIELEELEASMTLAGDGAHVRESLTAKAAAIRLKGMAQIESAAQAKSETMVLPVMLMFTGFLILIGYPALSALSRV